MTDNEQKRIFSKNLSRYIYESGKSQKEIAGAIGVLPSTFNTWVKGVSLPGIGKVQALADYFGILKTDLIDEQTPEAIQQRQIEKLISDAQIRKLVLFAGGMPPGDDRDKLIDAVIGVLSATMKARQE